VVFVSLKIIAFLDHRTLFPGHTLVVPSEYVDTLTNLQASLTALIFDAVSQLTRGIEAAMNADGSFVAINNRVSQSVPHLHVHVVPRRNGDGLRGFFWPRGHYASAEEKEQIRQRIATAAGRLSP